MSMKFKSWVMDLQEGVVDRVQYATDYVHDKIVPDEQAVRSIELKQRWHLENQFRFKHIKKLNPDLVWEYEFEINREAMCGTMDGSSHADFLDRLIGEIESDPDYVDPFLDNPELAEECNDYVKSEIEKINCRQLRLKQRRAKRQYDRYEKRRYDHGYL